MSAAPLLSYLSDFVSRIITPPPSPTTEFDGRLPHDFWLSCVEKGVAVPPTAIKVKPAAPAGFKGQAPR